MDKFTSVRHEQTMTQYMFGQTGMVSYDDEQAICDKTEYAQVHGLNGCIIWELSGDLNEDGSTPLLDAANAKLRNPDLDCADRNGLKEAGELMSGAALEESAALYYPSNSAPVCLSDGKQSKWLPEGSVHDTVEVRCVQHLSFSHDQSSLGVADKYLFCLIQRHVVKRILLLAKIALEILAVPSWWHPLMLLP